MDIFSVSAPATTLCSVINAAEQSSLTCCLQLLDLGSLADYGLGDVGVPLGQGEQPLGLGHVEVKAGPREPFKFCVGGAWQGALC